MALEVVLTALDDELTAAWRAHCADLPRVTVEQGSILDVDCDAVVSPANSYGFMQGGIDGVYTRHFGPQVQERLQERLRVALAGELPVGCAEIVTTDDAQIPFVVSAPTMRVPMRLPADTAAPYLAARAALLLVRDGSFWQPDREGDPVAAAVHRLAFPGLGTGTGGIAPETCAHQVRRAIEDVLVRPGWFPATSTDAAARHRGLVERR